jgi:hypothetical protein
MIFFDFLNILIKYKECTEIKENKKDKQGNK